MVTNTNQGLMKKFTPVMMTHTHSAKKNFTQLEKSSQDGIKCEKNLASDTFILSFSLGLNEHKFINTERKFIIVLNYR